MMTKDDNEDDWRQRTAMISILIKTMLVMMMRTLLSSGRAFLLRKACHDRVVKCLVILPRRKIGFPDGPSGAGQPRGHAFPCLETQVTNNYFLHCPKALAPTSSNAPIAHEWSQKNKLITIIRPGNTIQGPSTNNPSAHFTANSAPAAR